MPTVAEVMATELLTVAVSDTLGHVAREMRHRDVSSAMVVADDGAPVGIITERDLIRAVAASRNPDVGQAASWMTSDYVTVEQDADTTSAREVMRERAFRHLPVTDHGRLVGMVSIRDL